MPDFLDERFPVNISYGSAGGPVYQTAVINMRSGRDKRNINWSYPRHEYDAAVGVRRMTDLEDLIGFFHTVIGRAYSFRWKDWADYKSCKTSQIVTATDQEIDTGDGEKTEFQLIKNYTFGSYSRSRNITKPVEGTVVVAIDGSETEDFTVDTDTGKITFDSAPADGAEITAGYEFDVHARLDSDSLSTNLTSYQAGETEVPVIEIKEE